MALEVSVFVNERPRDRIGSQAQPRAAAFKAQSSCVAGRAAYSSLQTTCDYGNTITRCYLDRVTMMLRHLLTANMALTVVCFTAILQPEALAGTPELGVCMDNVDLGASKNTQWLACEVGELSRQERRLNREYKKLQASLLNQGVDAAKALVVAERQWLAFREAWCAFEGKAGGAPSPEFQRVTCMAELTEAQANRLSSSAN